jgi:DNA polymerase-3 subunit gamma/tau
LLELIDQFAATEGRMKWAPNKKLHFEVAIIKAIQSLGQATLDEVIEKLGELRDGGGGPPKKSAAVAAGVSPAPRTRAAGTPATTEPRVEEKSETIEPQKLWERVLAKIPAQKGFVRNSASAAHVLGIEGRNFKLGFASGDKPMMDILSTQANRKFVETLLHEIAGKDLSLRLTVNEELASRNAAVTEHSPQDFKDEALIQEAIELFNARVRT